MNIKQLAPGIPTVAYFICAAILLAGASQAQESRVASAMQLLESMTSQMGPAKIDGTDTVAGKEVPRDATSLIPGGLP